MCVCVLYTTGTVERALPPCHSFTSFVSFVKFNLILVAVDNPSGIRSLCMCRPVWAECSVSKGNREFVFCSCVQSIIQFEQLQWSTIRYMMLDFLYFFYFLCSHSLIQSISSLNVSMSFCEHLSLLISVLYIFIYNCTSFLCLVQSFCFEK